MITWPGSSNVLPVTAVDVVDAAEFEIPFTALVYMYSTVSIFVVYFIIGLVLKCISRADDGVSGCIYN